MFEQVSLARMLICHDRIRPPGGRRGQPVGLPRAPGSSTD
jgi:hypothetical protein